MKKGITTLFISLTAIAVSGCSSDSSTATTTPKTVTSAAAKAFPSGLAIASILAQSSSFMDEIEINSLEERGVVRATDFSSQGSAIAAVASGTTASTCKITLPNMAGPSRPACYGPSIRVKDAAGNIYQLPSGDLGIWTSSESGQACSAAELTSLIGDASGKVNAALMLSADMTCLMNVNSIALPAVGGTVDLTSIVNAAVQVNNSTTTISSATISQQSPSGSNAVYLFSITASINGTTSTINLKHIPTASDNSTYTGRVWSQFTSAGGNVSASSVLYAKTSSTAMAYRIVAADYPSSPTTVFTSSGNIAVNGSWNGNISLGVFNIDPTTGLGRGSYSWQAGTMDDSSRTFNVFTSATGSTVTGCGFFGFGARFDNSQTSLPSGTITKFVCDWAGLTSSASAGGTQISGTPTTDDSNSHTGLAGKAQKQCMTQTSGVFVPTTNAISYAPLNATSCADTGATPGPYSISTDAGVSFSAASTSSSLVTLSTDTDYASYTAPVAPTDF